MPAYLPPHLRGKTGVAGGAGISTPSHPDSRSSGASSSNANTGRQPVYPSSGADSLSRDQYSNPQDVNRGPRDTVTTPTTGWPKRTTMSQSSGSGSSNGPGVISSGNHHRPQPSKRDWSSSVTGHGHVLASPAKDLKPMRLKETNRDIDDMEFMQSVSRSGGDGAEGDALKDHATQEKFRRYIDERIAKHNLVFKRAQDSAPYKEAVDELESLTSIVLLFRKLREGVIASHRIDRFAIEVFESSARYAILARHTSQLLSSLSGLVSGLYKAVDLAERSTTPLRGSSDLAAGMNALDISDPHQHHDNRTEFASILLLYHLVQTDSIQAFHSTFLELTSVYRKSLISRYPLTSPSASTSAPGAGPASSNTERDSKPHSNSTSELPSPFLRPSDLTFALAAARALSPLHFSPLSYHALLSDHAASSTYERIMLGWAKDKVRERAWEVMRKAYIGVGTDWAAKWLAMDPGAEIEGEKEVEEWVTQRGGKVEGRVIKTR